MATAPSPRTWGTGDLLTASLLNSEIRNALNFLLNPPTFLAEALPATSLVNAAYTALTVGVTNITLDNYAGWASGTPTRYTPQVPGYYDFKGLVTFAANATGRRGVQIWVNGAGLADAQTFAPPTTSGATAYETTASHYMNGTTDYAEVRGLQDSGGALLTTAGASRFEAHWRHS